MSLSCDPLRGEFRPELVDHDHGTTHPTSLRLSEGGRRGGEELVAEVSDPGQAAPGPGVQEGLGQLLDAGNPLGGRAGELAFQSRGEGLAQGGAEGLVGLPLHRHHEFPPAVPRPEEEVQVGRPREPIEGDQGLGLRPPCLHRAEIRAGGQKLLHLRGEAGTLHGQPGPRRPHGAPPLLSLNPGLGRGVLLPIRQGAQGNQGFVDHGFPTGLPSGLRGEAMPVVTFHWRAGH